MFVKNQFLFIVLWVLIPPLSLVAQIPNPLPIGDYAGWLFFDGGGDEPLRLHVSEDSTALLIPSVAELIFELTSVGLEDDTVHTSYLARSGGDDYILELAGTFGGSSYEGRLTIGENQGSFELVRSQFPIPYLSPSLYADFTGVFRTDDDQLLFVDKRFWGELQYDDLSAGRRGHLFAHTDQTFFAGSALYVPDEVSAWATFISKDRMVWHRTSEAPRSATRISLQEDTVRIQSGNIRLAATLVKPEGEGPFPAVVIQGGSSWRTRSHVMRRAQFFASIGVAALIYDKRGYGDTGGEKNISFQQYAEDALAAVAYLATRADIDGSQIGITGESQGGWVAPLAASQSDQIAFMILWVAPSVSPMEQETTRRINRLKSSGVSEAEIELARKYLDAQWAYGLNGKGWKKYAQLRQEVFDRGWEVLGGSEQADDEAWQWIKLNMAYDPRNALEKINIPTLALYGGEDDNVVPSINVPELKAAMAKAGNKDCVIEVVKGANHIWRLTGQGDSRIHRSQGYAPEHYTLPAAWLEGVLKPAKVD